MMSSPIVAERIVIDSWYGHAGEWFSPVVRMALAVASVLLIGGDRFVDLTPLLARRVVAAGRCGM
jgi:hypothetical protein